MQMQFIRLCFYFLPIKFVKFSKNLTCQKQLLKCLIKKVLMTFAIASTIFEDMNKNIRSFSKLTSIFLQIRKFHKTKPPNGTPWYTLSKGSNGVFGSFYYFRSINENMRRFPNSEHNFAEIFLARYCQKIHFSSKQLT